MAERCMWEGLALLQRSKLLLHSAVLDTCGSLLGESDRERQHAEYAVEGLEEALTTTRNAASYTRALLSDQRERELFRPQATGTGG